MQQFTCEHTLPVGEVDIPGAEMSVRQAVWRDVIAQARADVGDDLPQDHSIDETTRPDGEGGLVIGATLTVP